MHSDWPRVRLGDHIDSCLGKMLDKKKNKGIEQPYLGNSNVRWGEFDLSDLAQMKFEESEHERYGITYGDLIVCEGGEPGRCAIWKAELPDMKIQKALHRIRTKSSLYNRYLYYWFHHAGKHGLLEPYFTGTTIKHLTGRALNNLEIPLPPLSYQEFMAKVLGSLDDKIQLNNQINQTLEQMAQAIFKSWFVDFEPVKAKIAAREQWLALQPVADATSPVCYADVGEPLPDLNTWMNLAAMQAISGKSRDELARLQAEQPEQYAELRTTAELFPSAMQDSELGEIPEGWGVDHLSGLIQFNPRRSLKKGTLAPYLDMKNVPTSGHLADDVVLREMNSGTKFINGDTLLARITPCLENGKTAYVDFLDSDQVGWGSTEYIVMRSQEPYPESISYFIARDESFRQHAIQSMTGTSGRQRANAKALAELPWIVYPHALAEAFDRISTPYLKLAKSHGNESKSLSAIRDAALPKLLSGELSVSDAENQLAENAEPANV